ncbi:type II toxin-antitoxin system RelE/ParE family toxin [Lunatimonas lonarensis]|uniref:type II toxin-antitoxin system RelE/ParE family toxin n=1 Tax=Lunatimonas lonarensis TaxID=1232681 RepID=UPI00269BC57F|nr:type II toxin-antitoxin system RelE/ParE family toxin [Lunatimonas lonarensis]
MTQKIFSVSYRVKSIEVFERQAKKLTKKYPSLKSELVTLVQELKENPDQGTAIGKSCYKIRVAIKSKGKGKSGGARVITNFMVANDAVYLLSIYDKSGQENISDKELDELLQFVPE